MDMRGPDVKTTWDVPTQPDIASNNNVCFPCQYMLVCCGLVVAQQTSAAASISV